MASREDKFTMRTRWPLSPGLDVDVTFSGEQPPTAWDYDLLIDYLTLARKTAAVETEEEQG
jgi:hypothetical protein